MKILRIPLAIALLVFAGRTFNADAQTVTILHSFVGSLTDNDGELPFDVTLVQGSDGDFYGTTSGGGTFDGGTVFRISSSGSLTTLYPFGSFHDGSGPEAGLVQGSDGNFYGTTTDGGTNGLGTVFRISASGSETILYSFGSHPDDGANPEAAVMQGSDGNLYGTTTFGGTNGNGTVFRISLSGNYTSLHSFVGFSDGASPEAAVVQGSDGNLYGTTFEGGVNGAGTVFRISPNGSFTNLYSFVGFPTDGSLPYGGLVQGSDGNFYGTTIGGGTNDDGTVFRISPSGSYMNLYTFVGSPNDGKYPYDGVQASDGNFYGTTRFGGTSGSGTVFRISPSGSYTNLYSFGSSPSDGLEPFAGLVQGSDGNFYGTTPWGGTSTNCSTGCGTVFKLAVPLSPPPYPINQITSIRIAATNVIFTIPSVAGETYQLQLSSSMAPTNWVNIPGASIIDSIGGILTLTNFGGASQTQAFYRAMINIGGLPLLASDNAADPAYSGGWTNGSNGGTGFSPWTLTETSTSINSNGFFIGSSTNNAAGMPPGIDVAGESWGIYANGGNDTAAYRSFASGSMPVGNVFKIDMRNGFIDAGDSDGFVLRNGNATNNPAAYNTNSRFEFLYLGDDSSNSYKVVDAAGLYNIGVPFTGTGLHLIFTLNTVNTYTLQVIDNASDVTLAVVNGTLGGTLGSPLNSLALYDRNAGAGSTNNCFFNSLEINGP